MLKHFVIENFPKGIFRILTKKKSIMVFQKNIFIFQKLFFFDWKKKLRKFSIHYIDVKFSEESIFRIFRAV